jgi:hypothetical protein
MATVEEIHAASEIKDIPLPKIRVDRSYQREVSLKLVDKIADEWDVVAAELPIVSDRGPRPEGSEVEGGLFIVNGQHRILAARKLGHTKITCRVINLRKEEDPGSIEAAFRLKTNVRLGDKSSERFKALLRAGDEEAHAIQKLLAKFDTEINLVPTTERGINCISAVEEIYRLDDGSTLTETLEVMRDSFRSIGGKNAGSNIFKAISWFVAKHSGESDRSRLVEKLSVLGVAAWESKARVMQSTMMGSLWLNFYRILVDIYNEKLSEKSRLQWQIRGSGQRGGAGKWGVGEA